ncbi:MAG: hypothetical protein WC614_12430 [bacterium]
MKDKKLLKTIAREYLFEILDIYDKVCSIEPNNYIKLVNIKKQYLDFNERLEIYKVLYTGLSNEEIAFLKNQNITDFNKEHIELEGLIWFHIMYGVLSTIWSKKEYEEYIKSSVELSKYKFARTYGKLFYYSYSLNEKSKILSREEETDKNSIEKIITEKVRINNNLKQKLPKDKKLLAQEIKNIEKYITSRLNLYKKTVEENFFEIRNLFRWYNKDIRIYITDTFKSNGFLVQLYPSQDFNLTIYPKRLTIHNTMNFNMEEISSEPLFAFFTFVPEQFTEKMEELHILSELDNILPFKESLEIFWSTSTFEDKLFFIKKLFRILGYKLEEINNLKHIFSIKDYNYNIFNRKTEYKENNKKYFILPQKAFLNKSDSKKIVQDAKSNLFEESKDNIYTIAKGYTDDIKVLEENNINKFDLKKIASDLVTLDLFDFIKPFLIESILKKDDINLKKQIKGKQLIDSVADFDESKKTWKQFEELMEKVFEYLFKDSFKHYFAKPQLLDYEGHRKPDLVVSNATPISEFWKYRKSEQKAKRIVIDFKNYSKEISSSIINDVTKYLNDKKGNFAIIISKFGFDSPGKKEQQIRYFDHEQLIIDIDTSDIIEMINYTINNKEPEEVLERKITALALI